MTGSPESVGRRCACRLAAPLERRSASSPPRSARGQEVIEHYGIAEERVVTAWNLLDPVYRQPPPPLPDDLAEPRAALHRRHGWCLAARRRPAARGVALHPLAHTGRRPRAGRPRRRRAPAGRAQRPAPSPTTSGAGRSAAPRSSATRRATRGSATRRWRPPRSARPWSRATVGALPEVLGEAARWIRSLDAAASPTRWSRSSTVTGSVRSLVRGRRGPAPFDDATVSDAVLARLRGDRRGAPEEVATGAVRLPSAAVPVAVLMAVGPGEREVRRADDVIASILRHEPAIDSILLVDDAPRGARSARRGSPTTARRSRGDRQPAGRRGSRALGWARGGDAPRLRLAPTRGATRPRAQARHRRAGDRTVRRTRRARVLDDPDVGHGRDLQPALRRPARGRSTVGLPRPAPPLPGPAVPRG